MQNQYSLRLKDMALADKVRKLSEKFGSEADAERARYAGLAADKDEQRAAYEAQMAAAAERQQVGMAFRFRDLLPLNAGGAAAGLQARTAIESRQESSLQMLA